jgi:hypothetical protein
VQFGPRYSRRLLDAIERLALERVSIAEINRRVGAEAERLGCARPSYERVRELVHRARAFHAAYLPASDILLDIAFRARSPYALTELHNREPRRRLRDQLNK